jgi:tRNA threonylcarbamoyladenosine dehydratase
LTVKPELQRLQLLTGAPAIDLIAKAKVIIFGIGGVGSWCAEALVRSGIGTLAIVDSDVICVTNINRQVQATMGSVGKLKTAELGRRLREIRPDANIVEKQAIFSKTTASGFNLADYDYVIDCIDSLSNKVELIIRATQSGAKLYTALGASAKLDPTLIKIGSIWSSYNCPLGKFVRKKLRQRGFTEEVTCVYSPEETTLPSTEIACGANVCLCPEKCRKNNDGDESVKDWCSTKKQINGSVVHITGTFGFMLAGLVIQDLIEKANSQEKEQKNVGTCNKA